MQQCSMRSCSHGAFTAHNALDFVQRWESSYGCNTAPMGQSVFVWLRSGEVCMMADVEEVKWHAQRKKSIEVEQLFQHEFIEILGIGTSYRSAKRHIQ